jgi:CubicO group peptidase (beta-lactamase class C family)
VHERYFGALDAQRAHIAWSVTKSFFGLIAASLVVEGRLDPQAPVSAHVPELAASGLGNATLRQVLDMTTAIDYSEDYTDPAAGIWSLGRAGGILPRDAGDPGPASFYEYLATLRQNGPHGRVFAYRTINTDVLGWVLRRVTGLSLGELLAQRVWSQLGAEHDGDLMVDATGTEFAGAGFNCCLRDLARFGEMLRNDGTWNGRQVVPRAAIDGVRGGGDPAQFAPAGYTTLPGGSYRDMWWVLHDSHGAYCARGIHGQGVYIDPRAEMVIARFASHPMAGNVNLDPTTLPAYRALAQHLMAG